MPLKIELKPNERIILGDSIVTNCSSAHASLNRRSCSDPAREGHHVARPSRQSGEADLSCGTTDVHGERRDEHYASYFRLVREMLNAAPAARAFIDSINNQILTGELYKALKEARKLIAYEEERPK